jgi:hypothetical protein
MNVAAGGERAGAISLVCLACSNDVIMCVVFHPLWVSTLPTAGGQYLVSAAMSDKILFS